MHNIGPSTYEVKMVNSEGLGPRKKKKAKKGGDGGGKGAKGAKKKKKEKTPPKTRNVK